jgi:hypothetical protein
VQYMSVNPQVQQHPASVDAYIRHGWSLVPIPHGTKGPTSKGWNLKENTLVVQSHLPPGFGIGLAHAYSGTMALDVDVWDRAALELSTKGINLQALYDAPDAVVIDSGRQGHGKLLYAMPMGIPLPSKKLIDTRTNEAGDEERYNYLDFRCATANGLTVQDVLPPSIHPDTNQPYRWAGRGHWMRLPVIPDTLLKFWRDLLAADSDRTLPSGSGVNASWDEIRGALEFISPDCSREEWVTVGMALHYAGTTTGHVNDALALWDEWSQPSSKYPGDRAILVQWNSFRPDKATSVRLGSLFRLASKGGWVKPAPDVTTLFQSTSVKDPVQMTMDMRPPPPDLDLTLFPDVLRRRAAEVSESVGCDPLVPLFAGLAAVSGAIDARTRLHINDGFEVPPVLWVCTIGSPADKKTPGSSPMFSVLDQLEREDIPRYKQALQVYEALEVRHEASKKAFLDAAKDVHGMLAGEVPQGYGEAPVPPVKLRIVVQDITSQKLVRHGADMPRGLLCYLDEMFSWVNRLTDKHSGEHKSTWTESYESRRHVIDRVGAGTIEAENFAVSIYGNMQPQVFRNKYDALAEDGFLQRFVPVVLRPKFTRLSSPRTRESTNTAQYDQMIRTAFGLPAVTYRLSGQSYAVFREFERWHHAMMRDEALLRTREQCLQAMGKLVGLTGRITLVMHAMENPYSTEVSAGTVERAVRFVKTYVIPVMRFAHNGDMAGAETFDTWCADYVVQYADQPKLTMTQIRRSARRWVEKMNQQAVTEMIFASMYVLEQAGWVARADGGEDERYGRAEWFINPQLSTTFKEHRQRVIEAKQRRMDETYKLSTKEKPKVYGFENTTNQEVKNDGS